MTHLWFTDDDGVPLDHSLATSLTPFTQHQQPINTKSSDRSWCLNEFP